MFLVLGLISEISVLYTLRSDILLDAGYLVGLLSTLPFLAVILYAPAWLAGSAISPARYPRLVGWWLGGLATFLLINVVLIPTVPIASTVLVVGWVRWAIVIGAGVGLLIGIIEARAIERATVAERAAVRAEHLERQRDLLDYLNSILRHEVLNAATIIDGYACRLRDEPEPLSEEGREWASIIHEKAADLEAVIDDVRVLLATTSGDHEIAPVELTGVLQAEVTELQRARDDVSIETAMPSSVHVRGDELLSRVFGNLLANAVEHNDGERAHVSITVEDGDETVRVEIADDGPGIPPADRESLFERETGHASTHGLGLYLVDSLVTQYGGTVALTETGAAGSTFVVELPRASTDGSGDSAGEARSPPAQ